MNMHKLYKILLVTFVLFAIQHTTAQPEYKISAEGFTFGKPVGNNVKLTVFLSASNTGSIEEFTGQLRNIKLISRQDNSGSYILDDYKKVLDNDKELNGYNVFSLSYIVPVGATDLTMIMPELYGNLSIPITKENYEQWVAKGNNAENSPSVQKKASKSIVPFTKYVGIGIGFELSVLNNSAQGSKSGTFGALSIEILPKILNFGKKSQSVLFGQLTFNWGGLFGGDAGTLKSIYQPDTSFNITDGDSSGFNYISYGAGLGYYFDIGKIKPVVSAGIVNTEMIPIRIKENNYNIPNYSALGYRLEAGFEIAQNFFISYVFRYFQIKDASVYLQKIHRMHSIKLSIWGWDK